MKQSGVVLTAVTSLLLFSLFLPPLSAEIMHAETQHPNGDCSWLCNALCRDLVKKNEEKLGKGSCANFSPDPYLSEGTGPTEGFCSSDESGPDWRAMNCTLTQGCKIWGTLKCSGYFGGSTLQVKHPGFTMTCPSRGGRLPRAAVTPDSVTCSYPDEGLINTARCDGSGNVSFDSFFN
jgi:hypothetical protein